MPPSNRLLLPPAWPAAVSADGEQGTLLADAQDVMGPLGQAWVLKLVLVIVVLLTVLKLAAWLRRTLDGGGRLVGGEPVSIRSRRLHARRAMRRGENEYAGDLLRGAGDLEQALDAYRQAGADLKAAEILSALGRFGSAGALYERAGVHEEAAECYRKAGDLKRAEDAYVSAGKKLLVARMFEQAGELAKAARYFREVNRPDKAAELLEKLGRARDAATMYEKLFSQLQSGLERGDGQARKAEEAARLEGKVADLYRQAGEREALLDFYLRAGLFFKAAELCLELGQGEKAVDLFIRARREDRAALVLEGMGRILHACRLRGDLALRQGELHNAARQYEAAAELRLAGECYDRLGDTKKAATSFEAAGDIAQAAGFYAKAGAYEQAAERFEKVGDLEAALTCYQQLGDKPKVAQVYARAGRWVRAGEIHYELGQLDEAIGCLQRVPANAADAAQALALLAAIFYEKGMPRVALQKIDEALRDRKPSAENVVLFYYRGRILERLEEREAATRAYEQVVALDIAYRDAARRLELLGRGEVPAVEATLTGRVPREKPVPGLALAAAAAAMGGRASVAVATEMKALAGAGAGGGGGDGKRGGAGASVLAKGDTEVASPPGGPAKREPETIDEPGRTRAAPKLELPVLQRGRYQILEEIGRGGMGIVYKCRDCVLDRLVAYKVLSAQIRDYPAAVQNFLREAKSAARLNHPDIVVIYDFGEADGSYYMTLEYVEGKNFRHFMKAAPPEAQIRRVLLGICDGLSYAHEMGVIHRDIKPANILIAEPDKKAKLLDFGLAKVIEEAHAQTASGVLGTPWYMSPEQVLGEPTDHRTDIYSLGVTMFEVFCGEPPFKGRDFGYHHVHTLPPEPRAVNQRVSRELSRVILRCLEKRPEDRFEAATALRDALVHIPLIS